MKMYAVEYVDETGKTCRTSWTDDLSLALMWQAKTNGKLIEVE